MALQTVPPMNVADALVDHAIDFSDVLSPSGTISSIVGVKAMPNNITVSGGTIGAGKRPGCLAQFQVTPQATGLFLVTAEIVAGSETLNRSILIPVGTV
jgi:hypothetical protein